MTFTNHDAIVELARQIKANDELKDKVVERAAEAGRAGNKAEEARLMKQAFDIVKLNKLLAKDMARFTT